MIVKSLPVLVQIFATPKDHRKAKPFHDHVFVFSIVDGHVWFRNYQVIYLSICQIEFLFGLGSYHLNFRNQPTLADFGSSQ